MQHFDIPGEHNQLVIVAESVVEQQPLPDVPGFLVARRMGRARRADRNRRLLGDAAAQHLCRRDAGGQAAGQAKWASSRRDDPLMLVHELNQRLFEYFEYVPRSTRVDSPIDEAIVSGKGVCQDFAHTMIALLRHVRIPARYVSGYLYRSREDHDRSTPDATHAWVEALLPHLGWVGFDPTNNLVAHHRHIRTAVGRDYADVPPTHGIFRGKTASELYVAVQVKRQRSAARARSQAAHPRRLERAGGARPAASRASCALHRSAADAAAAAAAASQAGRRSVDRLSAPQPQSSSAPAALAQCHRRGIAVPSAKYTSR